MRSSVKVDILIICRWKSDGKQWSNGSWSGLCRSLISRATSLQNRPLIEEETFICSSFNQRTEISCLSSLSQGTQNTFLVIKGVFIVPDDQFVNWFWNS